MKKERNISIDRYRGIIVFAMIFFQFIENFKSLGIFSTFAVHAPNCFPKTIEELANGFKGIFILPNLTLADLIAPAFIFAIGLTMIPSYNRKKEQMGKKGAILNLLVRYLILTGIGIMFSSINVLLDGNLFNKEAIIIDIPVFIITIISLIIFLLNSILKNKKLSTFLKYSFSTLGIIGILITLTNTIVMALGISETNLGYWGTLQHIGLAGIFATLVIAMLKDNKASQRTIVGIIIIILFTAFHESILPTLKNNLTITNNMELIDNLTDGGFLGAFAYSGILLIFTALADLYYENKSKYRLATILLAIPTAIVSIYAIKTFTAWDLSNNILTSGLSNHLSINKGSISPSYLIITLFTSSFAFMIVDLFQNIPSKINFFNAWGRNPIVMYILEFGFIGALTSFLPDFLMSEATIPVALIVTTITFTILSFIAYKLYKKDKIVKI